MASPSGSAKYFQLKVLLFLVLFVFAWLLFEYSSLVYRSYMIDVKKAWFEQENARLEEENRELAKRFQYFQTDYFLLREAKRTLNLREPGEKVLVVSDDPLVAKGEQSWWVGEDNPAVWWRYVFGDRVYGENSKLKMKN